MKKKTTKEKPKTKTIPARDRLIDKVTTKRLDTVLRMAGYELNKTLIDRIIDLVELIEDKGDNVSLRDVYELQEEWNNIPF